MGLADCILYREKLSVWGNLVGSSPHPPPFLKKNIFFLFLLCHAVIFTCVQSVLNVLQLKDNI